MRSNNCYPSSKFNKHLWPRYAFRERYRQKVQFCRNAESTCLLPAKFASFGTVCVRYCQFLAGKTTLALWSMQINWPRCKTDLHPIVRVGIGIKLDRIGMQNQNCFKRCTSRVSIGPMCLSLTFGLLRGTMNSNTNSMQIQFAPNSTKRLSGHWGTKPRKITEVINFILTWPPCQI